MSLRGGGGMASGDNAGVMDIAAASAPLPVRSVDLSRPLAWLAAGWRDFARSPLAGLVHGGFVALGGWVVVLVSLRLGWVAPGAFSGFVILGPILVTGLYEISRLHARGQSRIAPVVYTDGTTSSRYTILDIVAGREAKEAPFAG